MTDSCKGCGHPTAEHYRGPDPEYPSLDSMYCSEDGCMCWERYAINRPPELTRLTPERKPQRQ